MKIIPVIDILHGQVVHAKRGQREHYAPIISQLCTGSAPVDVIAGLLKLYPFDTLYIADLDAIQFGSLQSVQLTKIHQEFPQLKLWLDAGLTIEKQEWIDILPHIYWVIGTENLSSIDEYHRLTAILNSNMQAWALSLDFMNTGFRGPKPLEHDTTLWPKQVICMTLANVGGENGVDTERLQSLMQKADKSIALFAAGGVRYAADLLHLDHIGVKGALVATCLHHQQLSREEIASFMSA